MKLADIVIFNPKETIKKGDETPFIDMAALPINNKFVDKLASKPYRGGGAKFKNGDTLFARITPCLENGKGAIVSRLEDGEVACGSTEFIVLRAQEKSDEAFVYYVTRAPAFRQFAEKRMFGTSGRQRVPWQALTDFELNDFSTDERLLIGDVLSSLDNKIELNRQMNEVLERQARAVFKDWFVDFGPVVRKKSGEKDPVKILGGLIKDKQKAKTTAALFPYTFGDNGLPLGWEETDLSRVVNTNAKSWTKKNKPKLLRYIDLSNTKWGIVESTALLTWDEAPTRARRIVHIGDTIVATTRPGNGSYSYISQDGFTASTGFAVLSPTKNIYRDLVYIGATLSTNITRLSNLAKGHGGAYPAIKPNVVSETELIFAGDEIIEKFAEISSAMRMQIEHNKKENQTLAETRDYLLPKLMSGEIRVGDVAAQSAEPASSIIDAKDLFGRKIIPADKTVERDAVMVAAIIRAFDNNGHVVGNFRYQKAMYFMRRRLAHSLATTTKKAAGPYDGALRYSGGHTLAIRRKYIREAFINSRTGNKPASKISEIDSLITQYDLQDALTWIVQKFKFKSSDEFECLATVDFAMNELRTRGAAINVTAIQHDIASDPAWKPKLTKSHFAKAKIRDAIGELERLFGNG